MPAEIIPPQNTPHKIQDIKARLDIVQLAKDQGMRVKGKLAQCFNAAAHRNGDRHYSLGFYADNTRFKCFACDAGGDAIDLYCLLNNVDLSTAIKELGGSTIYPCSKMAYPSIVPQKRVPIDAAVQEQNSIIYEALADYCGPPDEETMSYLTGSSRGLTAETITRFKLFSISNYGEVTSMLRHNFSMPELQQAGLWSKAKKLMFYKHKIIIPFYRHGRVVFLQGRRLGAEQPRYLHLANIDVPLFNTDSLCELPPNEKVYLCEGVFDAMMMEQKGYRAFAILGINNFKPEMAEALKDYAVCLALDNPKSGGTEAEREREIALLANAREQIGRQFLEVGKMVTVMDIPPEYKDITEYFINHNQN